MKHQRFVMLCKDADDELRRVFPKQREAASARLVWLALCRLGSDKRRDTFEARISLIAKLASCSYRTAADRLKDLERVQFIAVRSHNVPQWPDGKTFTLLRTVQSKNTGSQSLADERLVAPPEGKLAAAFKALCATGKLPALKYDHLARVDQSFPHARLAENFPELVEEAQGMTGVVGDTAAWLRSHVSNMEVRKRVTGAPKPESDDAF